MDVEFLEIPGDFNRIEAIWTRLSSVPDVPYFLSWGWMENWLTSLPAELLPRLALCSEDGAPVLAFFFGKANVTLAKLFKSRGLFVNATGCPEHDSIWIEYNRFLCGRRADICCFEKVLELLPEPWEEVLMPGLDADGFPGNSLDQVSQRYVLQIDKDHGSPYVDLKLVREKGDDYLSLLSANTRYQIKRSFRIYESRGPVVLDIASDVSDALSIYDEMVRLHQEVWEERGMRGAFGCDYFCCFHKQLILKRLKQGEIQLLRIRAGNSTIGCLYNFVFRKKVYFYQSGLTYEADKRLKPGLISHAKAIQYNTEAGNEVYDFLGEASQYKKSLATHENRLVWARIRRRHPKFALENRLRMLKQIAHRILSIPKRINPGCC